ncbi:MAG TPA: hypothetical protein VFQ65_10745 [Kofleriaceae bacterium]|nr:hypothetical protein [Kofleriaceae bacterium]
MRRILVLASLAACGSDNTKTIDAAKAIDAPKPIDAMPDALFDAPAPPPNAHRFVIDHEHQPTNSTEARMYGLDLNGDATIDNQLGMVLATFAGMGLSSQPGLDHAIDTGAIEILADVEAMDLTTAAQATVTLFDGANAMPAPCHGGGDTTCRHHLAGTATFDIATTSAHDTPLAGAIAAGVLDAGPGTLHLRSVILGAPVDLKLIGARVRLTQPSDPGIMTGVIAGAITQAEIDASLIPALQAAVTVQIALDCGALTTPPGCGCADGSTGKTFVGLFDANHDCAVTIAEIKNNALIISLLAPDVTIDAMPALSLGVGVSAVHAAFTP